MAEKYRKIICPNGHYSDAVKESNPLPRRCTICRQQYLRTSKPIWCNSQGEVLEEGIIDSPVVEERKEDEMAVVSGQRDFCYVGSLGDGAARRRKRTPLLDDSHISSGAFVPENRVKETINKVDKTIAQIPTYFLTSGDYSIALSGEGILGRDNIGRECMSVNHLVSRSHCFFIVTKQKGLEIRDAGSLNGTFVDTGNGRIAVSKTNGVYLKAGDRLWLADMLFEVKEAF